MAALFADHAGGARQHRRGSPERIGFTLENLDYRFPDYHDGRGHPLSLAEQATLLRRFTYAGAARRYRSSTPHVRQQLEHELGDDPAARVSRVFPHRPRPRRVRPRPRHPLPGPGIGGELRGLLCARHHRRRSGRRRAACSSASSSDNRKSWPDIDIDFPSGARREEVIQYVFRKYGARNAAMTANVITYRPKSAFREMSKVLGFPPSVADRFSNGPSAFHGEAGKRHTRDRRAEFEDRISSILPPSHPRLPALARLYQAVLGLPRHLGQHSGGMIICDHGLDAVVPLQPATMPGRTVVQWDKDDCEDMGIVKIDLLGLGMLAAMEHALEIRARRGQPVDLAAIPKDDPAVFDLLCRADTIGTFQVESRAQMATLPIMRPRTFYDLAIEVAIIRPGPIVGDLVHPYLNRRNGREAIDYIHPDCEEILEPHARRAACSRNKCCAWRWSIAGFHRRRGRRTAPRDGLQAQRRTHGTRDRTSSGPRMDRTRHRAGQSQRQDRRFHRLLRACMVSRKATPFPSPSSPMRAAGSRCIIRRSFTPDCSTTSRWDSTRSTRSSRTRNAGNSACCRFPARSAARKPT